MTERIIDIIIWLTSQLKINNKDKVKKIEDINIINMIKKNSTSRH